MNDQHHLAVAQAHGEFLIAPVLLVIHQDARDGAVDLGHETRLAIPMGLIEGREARLDLVTRL